MLAPKLYKAVLTDEGFEIYPVYGITLSADAIFKKLDNMAHVDATMRTYTGRDIDWIRLQPKMWMLVAENKGTSMTFNSTAVKPAPSEAGTESHGTKASAAVIDAINAKFAALRQTTAALSGDGFFVVGEEIRVTSKT